MAQTSDGARPLKELTQKQWELAQKFYQIEGIEPSTMNEVKKDVLEFFPDYFTFDDFVDYMRNDMSESRLPDFEEAVSEYESESESEEKDAGLELE